MLKRGASVNTALRRDSNSKGYVPMVSDSLSHSYRSPPSSLRLVVRTFPITGSIPRQCFEFRVGCQPFWLSVANHRLSCFLSSRVLGAELPWTYNREKSKKCDNRPSTQCRSVDPLAVITNPAVTR